MRRTTCGFFRRKTSSINGTSLRTAGYTVFLVKCVYASISAAKKKPQVGKRATMVRVCCIRGASRGLQSNRESKLAAQGTEESNELVMA